MRYIFGDGRDETEDTAFDFESFKERREVGDYTLSYDDLKRKRVMQHVFEVEGMNTSDIAEEINANPDSAKTTTAEVYSCLKWHLIIPAARQGVPIHAHTSRPPWRQYG